MKKIKLFDPVSGISEKNAVIKVLNSHFWASGEGNGNVKKFEDKFSKYVSAKDSVAVNSGTAALNLALSMLDIENKEVILPSLSFVSTAHSVIINGGKPVFADIDPNTMCLDPEQIKKLISKNTKVILPVHFGGMPSNLKKIKEICDSYNLSLIEDAAHAAGSCFDNRKIGSHGDMVCFSFHPVKNLAMPTGGLITINTSDFKQTKKILNSKRWCGITNRKNSIYDVKELGWNYYMNEFSATIGLIQLRNLEKFNKIRKIIARKYVENILVDQKMPFDKNCSYHLYWILVKNRKNFRKKMFDKGIETGIHYNPIHQMTMYKKNIKLPITEEIGKKIVSIPLHPNLNDYEVEKITKYVNMFS